MWDSVLGHEQNKAFLTKFLQAQARPHALLFTGGEGLGKKQLALAFAKTLLCLHQKGDDGCESCRLLNFQDGNLSHPDFILLQRYEDKTEILIDQIRNLISQAAFAPVLSPYKVCIIEDADRMNISAANSFLKLLEEPPAGWLIILLATQEEALLPTILSRVVTLRFHPVPLPEVEQHLLGLGISQEQSRVLARLSEGSIGLARRLQEQEVWSYRQTAWELLQALPLQTPVNYIGECKWIEKYTRPEAILLIKLCQLLLRDMLLLRSGLSLHLYNCDWQQSLADLAEKWSIHDLKSALSVCNEAYRALQSNASVKLVLEACIMKIDMIRKERG